MSYLVFARKYRPQSFDDVTGQESVVTTLKNALRGGRIAHAFCFAGPRGVGKTTTARLLARALNCAEGATADPCGKCESCVEIASSHSIDTIEIDGASNRGIDDVKQLRESLQYTPARDRYKLVIIDEVHMLSREAFNALLKTLEEPPPHVKFVFATTELHKLPATILSRCQVYEFRRIPFSSMVKRLRSILEQEGIAASDEALGLIANNSDGCMRDAESMLDQVASFGDTPIEAETVRTVLGLIGSDVLFEMMDAILREDGAIVLTLVDRLIDTGTDPREFAARFGEHLRNLLVCRLVTASEPLIAATENEIARLREQARVLSDQELLRLLNLLAQGEEDLKRTSAPRFTLERLLLKLVQSQRLTPLPDLLAALGGATVPTRPPRDLPAAFMPTPKPSEPTPRPERAAPGSAVAAAPAPATVPIATTVAGPKSKPIAAAARIAPPPPVKAAEAENPPPAISVPVEPNLFEPEPAPAQGKIPARRKKKTTNPTVAQMADLFKAEILEPEDQS